MREWNYGGMRADGSATTVLDTAAKRHLIYGILSTTMDVVDKIISLPPTTYSCHSNAQAPPHRPD